MSISSSTSSSRSSSQERVVGQLDTSRFPTRRGRSLPPPLKQNSHESQRNRVDHVSSNLRLGSNESNRNRNSHHQRKRSWTRETEPRGRDQTRRQRGQNNIRGISVDTHLRGSNAENSIDPQIKIGLKKVGSGSSDTAIKPYYIFEWNGHRYRLTHRYKEGAQIRQIGCTEKDWKALAEMQKTIWQTAKIQNPEKSNFNVEKRILNVKVQGNAGEPVTIDFKTQNDSAQQAINGALQAYKKVKKHPLRFTNGNPPPPSFPGQKKKKKPDASPQQEPINPLDSVPPPEEIPWWRIDKHIGTIATRIADYFKKSPPQSNTAPQIINPNSLLPLDLQSLNNLSNPVLPPVPPMPQILNLVNANPNTIVD